MGSWNFRLMQHKADLALHEVYYDDTGKPESFSTYPAALVGESVEELSGMLMQLQRALSQPALVYAWPIVEVGAAGAPEPVDDPPVPGLAAN